MDSLSLSTARERGMQRSGGNGRALGLSLVASALLLCLLGAACLSQRDFARTSFVLGIALATFVAVWLLRLFFRWLSARDLFAPWIAFPIAYVLWFCIGSVSMFDDPYPPLYRGVALGLICYLGGVWAARAMWQHGTDASRLQFRDDWSVERFEPLLAAIGVLTLVAYLSVALQIGVPALHFDAGERRLDLINYGRSQSIFMLGAWTTIVFLTTRFWVRSGRPANKVKLWLALVGTSVLVLSLGSRGNLLIPVSTALIARHYLRRRTRLGMALLLVALVFVVAGVLGWARDTMAYTSSSLRDLQPDSSSLFYLYFYIRDPVATLRDVMTAIPHYIPYQRGYLSFGALTSLLPGYHNESSDMFFRRILGSDFLGFGQPATLLGPMYGDFGMAGIGFQMFGLGIFYTWMYSWMCRRATFFRAVMYAWVSQVVLYSLFGSLLTYITTLLAPLGWILLNRVLRMRSVAARSSDPEVVAVGS